MTMKGCCITFLAAIVLLACITTIVVGVQYWGYDSKDHSADAEIRNALTVTTTINSIKENIGGLKGDLGRVKSPLPEIIKILEENKGKDGNTEITLSNDRRYTLHMVRRDMNQRLKEIKNLSARIEEKEAEIAEIQAKADKQDNLPSDDDLLKKAKDLLVSPIVAEK